MNDDVPTDLKAIIGSFDNEAPFYSYKVDALIQRILSKRRLIRDPLKVRKSLWMSAYVSALNDRGVRLLQSDAKFFLARLSAALTAIGSIPRSDPNDLTLALELNADRAKELSRLDRALKEHHDILELVQVVDRTSDVISAFLKDYVARTPERGSNREDTFIRGFIESCADSWKQNFGADLTKKDRSEFVGLLATALDDFRYPKTDEQKKSDSWLYNRVSKQLFRN